MAHTLFDKNYRIVIEVARIWVYFGQVAGRELAFEITQESRHDLAKWVANAKTALPRLRERAEAGEDIHPQSCDNIRISFKHLYEGEEVGSMVLHSVAAKLEWVKMEWVDQPDTQWEASQQSIFSWADITQFLDVLNGILTV